MIIYSSNYEVFENKERDFMLLYSTMLHIRDTMTKEAFLKLVIRWNQESPHEENVITELREWDGNRNKRYGNEGLWLDIEEYRNKNIIAVRFENKEVNGAVWNTDYIMNFGDMRMAIRLDRSYTEDALMEDTAFSTPHFLTLLIEEGYLKDDNGLPILRNGLNISKNNLDILTGIINGESKYKLPVVYVSKTVYNYDPVNIRLLGSKLKGVAHILIESDKCLNNHIRTACNDMNEYNGSIGIYFPNGAHRRFYYRVYTGSDRVLLDKVIRSVLQYVNAQTIPLLYTWAGVNNSLLTDQLLSQRQERQKAENAREKAENEMEEYLGAFDEDLEKYKKQINELTRANASLQMENQGLRAKLSGVESVPVLYLGDEDEFFQGEIKEMLLDSISEVLKRTPEKSRRADALNDILLNNGYQNIRERREKQIKTMFKDYKSLTGTLRQQLVELGFKIAEEGKHYRLTYYGDNRYKTTLSKSGSDHREGKNIALTILKNMM